VATYTDRNNGQAWRLSRCFSPPARGSVDVFAFSGLLQMPRAHCHCCLAKWRSWWRCCQLERQHRASSYSSCDRRRVVFRLCFSLVAGLPVPMNVKSRLSLAGSRLGTSSCRTTARYAWQ
jgi:hypothetical protein